MSNAMSSRILLHNAAEIRMKATTDIHDAVQQNTLWTYSFLLIGNWIVRSAVLAKSNL